MERLHARHVVIGAGAVGAATAYHLSRRGDPVLLVEQFPLGHERGSSHGAARIARHSYADPRYARLMPAAFAAWRELEADSGRPLFVRTGGVSLGPAGSAYVASVASNLADMGIPHRLMDGADLHRSTPAFAPPADAAVVFEPDAGMLAAAEAVATQLALATSRGAIVRDRTPISRIDLDADRPTLIADGLTITADRLIVAAGPWTARLVPGLGVPLRPERQRVAYFRPADPAPFSVGRLPVFIWIGTEPADAFYGMPPFLGQAAVKAARHGGDDTDPDEDDRSVDDSSVSRIRSFLRSLLPGLANAPVERVETCLYTLAPNDDLLIGPLANRSDVIVASPCSGHGFKFSSLIGQALAELATLGATERLGDLPRSLG